MDNKKGMEGGGLRFQSVLGDKRVLTELSSDFSLPDYQPEIKRLLGIRATVSPADRYVGAGSAELSGNVEYNILYSGNDGALYCSRQNAEYRFTAPLELPPDFEIGEGVVCEVETLSEPPTGRVIGPRHLCIKCRLRSRVRFLGTRVIGEAVSGVEQGSLERLMGSIECGECFVGVGEALHLGDEILCEHGGEDLRVITSEAQAYVSEALAGSGCINCRGEVTLKLLCARDGEDGVPFAQWRKIPFSSSVPVDGVEVNCTASVRGVCTDVTVSVEEGRILCEVTLHLMASAQRNVNLPYTKDVYSTVSAGETRSARVEYRTAGRCIGGNFSVNTTLSMEEAGLRRGQTVADLSLVPTVTELENDNGHFVLSGKCRCFAIVRTEEEYSSQEFELPFRYIADGDASGLYDYDAEVCVLSCRAREDGERLSVDAELAVNIVTRGMDAVDVFCEGRFEEEETAGDCSFTVCYPLKGDTLWDVSKRYRMPIARLLEENPLSGAPVADAADSLTGVKYLLI